MPLSDGYGVVIGTVARHHIDPPDSEGLWPHYHIFVDTPAGEYDCAINLKSRTETKIEYRDFRNLDLARFNAIRNLPDGFHSLSSNSSSGALDFIRHSGLQNKKIKCRCPRCKRFPFITKPCIKKCKCTQWWLESGEDLIQLMEYYLTSVSRIYIFGEPFNNGLGLHNIHMNQGDPIGSGFDAENGIWQDGGVLLEYQEPQFRFSGMLTKFQPQSLNTNDNGQPI